VGYTDVTVQHVLAAIAECDRMGQAAFLRHYRFGDALKYVLLHGGREYDSKAVVGVAHRHATGTALTAADFSGGRATVVSHLQKLGFTVEERQAGQQLILDPEAVTSGFAQEPRHWLLQCNPKRWDVWSWWEEEQSDLDRWTVSKHLKDMRPGDNFVLWIGGPGAGVYALGRLASGPYLTGDFDDNWITAPHGPMHVVDLRSELYLFDAPITKTTLAATPEFAHSLIIRMPGYGNPIPLTSEQWQVISSASGRGGRSKRPAQSEVIVTSRPLGIVLEDTATHTAARNGVIKFPEAKLVKAYDAFLGRDLRCLSARLPSGELLVCDAYDEQEDLIIEAKASSSRPDVRMAIGQLLDYQRHMRPQSSLAVLLPEEPTSNLADLLRDLDVKLIFRDGDTFRRPR
jgi:hypothetical protein